MNMSEIRSPKSTSLESHEDVFRLRQATKPVWINGSISIVYNSSQVTSCLHKMSNEVAQDRAARLLKKRGSISSLASQDVLKPPERHKKHHGAGSMSTVSYLDEPGHDDLQLRSHMKMEPTYQMAPTTKFPTHRIKQIIQDVIENYIGPEKYEPEKCRNFAKTISEIIKARVKELMIPRYKIICLVHIGQLQNAGKSGNPLGTTIQIASRCLWDTNNDTFASFEFRNNSLYSVGTVYGIYME